MKNAIKLLMCAVLAFAFVGCTPNEMTDESKLSTPNFSLRAEGNSIIVTWEQITGAAYYEVSLNPGSTAKTDKLIHKFDNLEYNTEYKVSVRAISTESSKNSDAKTKKIKTSERAVPQYREFLPKYGAAASAISNNGRWVVAANDRCGFVLDLSTDKMVEFSNAEFYDVADDGTAVGSDHSENPEGNAAILIGDQMVPIDLSNIATNLGMSCATGITPDANYIVGWFWEYDESSYYGQMYGMVVPFCYDVLKNTVTVPEVGERLYNEAAATAIKAVAPDRTLLGYEQTVGGINSILWADEYTPFEYVHFLYDEGYNPVFGLGDTQNLLTQTGRYIYGKATDYAAGNEMPAVYDRQTSELYTLAGGSVTAMSDEGIAFINDTPYYLGTTSYVIDIKNGEPYEWTALEEWLFDEHDIDIASFEPLTNENADDSLYLESVIVVAVSENGRIIVGITNTNSGWLTFVIDLDGAPVE
ncbi:MAG: hypothetical protein J6U73_01640 [Alistipes sp.]|nr:hypothetical protein [Alistipes sp.]